MGFGWEQLLEILPQQLNHENLNQNLNHQNGIAITQVFYLPTRACFHTSFLHTKETCYYEKSSSLYISSHC